MGQKTLEKNKDQAIVQSLRRCLRIVAANLLILSTMAAAQSWAAADEQQKTFSSPEAATQAVVAALRKDDRTELLAIFGKDAQGILTGSGDPIEDKNSVEQFLKSYDQMHRFSHGPDGKLFLIVGAENWPMPIPLDKNSSGWYFDTPYGKQELIYRRIGRNERSTIGTLNAIVVGEHQYYDQNPSKDATKQYARKILSTEGTQDGLYWKTAPGEPDSPIGPLVAEASQQGYRNIKQGQKVPVRGYYFKMLTKQGADAPGGAKDYIVDGKMTGGFAVLAYPAKYRSSGVMTFLVDADGDVMQKDLGSKTSELAEAIDSYNPDKSWEVVQ
jgi:Protein of unknown function (DUF2950)